MTHDEFIQLLHQPELVDSKHIPDLKEMVSYYPFFAEAKVLLARAMLISKNLHASHYVDHAALCVPDRRVLFFIFFLIKKYLPIPFLSKEYPSMRVHTSIWSKLWKQRMAIVRRHLKILLKS